LIIIYALPRSLEECIPKQQQQSSWIKYKIIKDMRKAQKKKLNQKLKRKYLSHLGTAGRIKLKFILGK
jgi:RNase P/RNase MRP subunit POP5